jgi:hypothetical protein
VIENGLELVRCVENEFAIYLSDEELSDIHTVGNLHNLLVQKLGATPDCLSARTFYQLRKAMVAVLGVARGTVRPTSFLDDIFDKKRIRAQWEELERESGLKLPKLRHNSGWKHSMLTIASFVSASCTMLAFEEARFIPYLKGFWVIVMCYLIGFILYRLLTYALLELTRFRRTETPVFTIAELARVVLSMNRDQFAETNTSKTTKDQVWLRLTSALEKNLGWELERITPCQTFAEETGIL